jgi:hypothetical protein
MARCCTGPSIIEAMQAAEAAAAAAEEAAAEAAASAGFETFYGFGPPVDVEGAQPGDHYVDLDTGTVYVFE